LEFVDQVHTAIRATITGLLEFYIKEEYPDLEKAAAAAAEQLLQQEMQPLKEAVKDAVLAHSYVVETLHNQVQFHIIVSCCSDCGVDATCVVVSHDVGSS
jgi:hypothetical protein